jgi:hypothetical protein
MEMFTVEIEFIFEALLADQKLTGFVRKLLDGRQASAIQQAPPLLHEVSRYFAEVLLAFLVDKRLDKLTVSLAADCLHFELLSLPKGRSFPRRAVTASELSVYLPACLPTHFPSRMPVGL